MGKKFDQKACILITKRDEFIGQVLEDEQACVVRVGIIHSVAHSWISNSLNDNSFGHSRSSVVCSFNVNLTEVKNFLLKSYIYCFEKHSNWFTLRRLDSQHTCLQNFISPNFFVFSNIFLTLRMADTLSFISSIDLNIAPAKVTAMCSSKPFLLDPVSAEAFAAWRMAGFCGSFIFGCSTYSS
jgi:hypothetical protein